MTHLEADSSEDDLKVLFLDMDGVLNDMKPHANKCYGTKPSCVREFNRILNAFPDLKIVVSSSWRWFLLNEQMTISGFEGMLRTHGVAATNRLVGFTKADGSIDNEPEHPDSRERYRQASLRWRTGQIKEWAKENGCRYYIVLDDTALELQELHLVDGDRGLTASDVEAVLQRIRDWDCW